MERSQASVRGIKFSVPLQLVSLQQSPMRLKFASSANNRKRPWKAEPQSSRIVKALASRFIGPLVVVRKPLKHVRELPVVHVTPDLCVGFQFSGRRWINHFAPLLHIVLKNLDKSRETPPSHDSVVFRYCYARARDLQSAEIFAVCATLEIDNCTSFLES